MRAVIGRLGRAPTQVAILLLVLSGCTVTTTAPFGTPYTESELKKFEGEWLHTGKNVDGVKRSLIVQFSNGKLYGGQLGFDHKTGEFRATTVELLITRVGDADYLFIKPKDANDYWLLRFIQLDQDSISATLPDNQTFVRAVENGGISGKIVESKSSVVRIRHVVLDGTVEQFIALIKSKGVDSCFPVKGALELRRRH